VKAAHGLDNDRMPEYIQASKHDRMAAVADVSAEIIKNAAMNIPLIRRRRLDQPRAGVRFTGKDSDLQRYAFQSLTVLEQITGKLQGQSVCEIGPGDFLTSGLALLAAGADSYMAIDRFAGDYSCLEGREWYSGIQAAWPRVYPEISWPGWLDATRFPEAYPERVRTSAVRIESAKEIGTFDIVCSFQVGEHVSDVEEFASSTARLLKPGGMAVHRIDFGPHGVWRSYRDPLTFLRIPEPVWQAMGSARGTPNRRRVHEVEAAFRAAGLSVHLTEIERYPQSASDLARLPARFRQMPPESVLTKTVVLVAERAASRDAARG
jgi:hypothetical protein